MGKFVFCCYFLVSISALAQDTKFSYGINTSGIWNSYLLTEKTRGALVFGGKLNWSAGLCSKYSVNKNLQIDAQINFATKNFGSGLDLSMYRAVDPNDPILANVSGKYLYTVRQEYLEVPISFCYIFNSDRQSNLFCSFGFTNSFFLSAKYDGQDKSYLASSNSDQVYEKYKSYLLSFRAGGGLTFPLSSSFFAAAEIYSNVYLGGVYKSSGNTPFQLALGFSVLKKLGSVTRIAAN